MPILFLQDIDPLAQRIGLLSLGPSPSGRKGLKRSLLRLTPPGRQMGRIQPLPPQERPQLTGLAARLRFLENPKLVGPWKPPPNRSLHHFRIAKRGKSPRKVRISQERDSRGSPSPLLLFFRRLHNRYHLLLLHARFSFPPYSKLLGRKCLTHCGTEGYACLRNKNLLHHKETTLVSLCDKDF
jgi:hypothetical protein